MIRGTLLLFTLMQQSADTVAGRPCRVAIDSIRGYYRQIVTQTRDTNYFAGGGVFAHCQGTGSTLSTDSLASYGAAGRVDLVGRVRIRDTTLALDANVASYHVRDERFEAHHNVVAVNRTTGTVLRGPNLTYWRAVRGVRDTAETYATGRPVIDYHQAGDSAEPYVIVADRVRFKGNDRMWGGGRATIDRSDLSARADSMQLDETAGLGVLVGQPRMLGKGTQRYTLVGTRIELGLREREVRLVKALGAGEATGADWRLTADTIHLVIDRRKLQQAIAWGDSSRPHTVATLYTIQSDSLALDVPDEVLTESRAFGRAYSTSKKDSAATAADLDWLAGDTITAHFAPEPDSTGAVRTRLRQLVARGSARALTHLYDERDSSAGPALNYSRGSRIAIALRGDRVDRVLVSGRADGVHLEPRPPAPPPADSTKRPAPRARR